MMKMRMISSTTNNITITVCLFFLVYLHGITTAQTTTTCADGGGSDDDDQRLQQIAAANGRPDILTCSDAVAACTLKDQVGAFVREVCCGTCSNNSCIDNDQKLAELAQANGYEDISACVDILNECSEDSDKGDVVRQLCCETCSKNSPDNTPLPESILPPSDDSETVQIFLLGGQSECTGSAIVDELDADAEQYPELQNDIDGVWFAGYSGFAGTDRFFIAPMNGNVDNRGKFGPEISFGERIYSVTQKRTIVMKYCVGGTNVAIKWNPETESNQWDKTSDDGTAQWLSDNGGIDFQSKDHLFINIIYTIRRTEEMLSSANIPFEWAGIVWVQGNADLRLPLDPIWKTFGENTARVWEGFREEIGSNIPIVDTGASTHNQLKSGKEYATQIVEGCQATSVEFATVANDDTSSDCVVGPSDPCVDSPNLHQNFAVPDYYGYDPLYPDDQKPPGSVDEKIFHWYSQYPANLHSAYEGMVLKGRMLANAYIREFTNYDLGVFEKNDPTILFPFDLCDQGTTATDETFCWIDYREESLVMDQLCSTTDNEEVPHQSEKSDATNFHYHKPLLALSSGLGITTALLSASI